MRVKLIHLSARMGKSRGAVWRYESMALVPSDIARDYREALASFRDVAAVA